jgi:CDP-diacylglycerol--glycerol-3-phosphate 3-phosphatidyltransferase
LPRSQRSLLEETFDGDNGERRKDCEPTMSPNRVTAARVGAAFAAVVLFTLPRHNAWTDLAALALTISAIGLDAVDGYLARRRNASTPLGAQLDILGDRIVENLFFTFFATSGLVSLWVPIFFFLRGTSTDFLRSLAARAGRSGFGKNGMLETWWGRLLVASRASRAAYAALKCICFGWLGLELTIVDLPATGIAARSLAWLHSVTPLLVAATVAFCLIRALPVIWEGRHYLFSVGTATTKTTEGATL